jgi:hypothetical protein
MFHRQQKGLTLIEACLAMAMIAIVATGALSYQYLGVKHIRIAQTDLAATRIGQLILEDWKGTGGVDVANYDLTTKSLGFQKPQRATSTADYYIIVDGTAYYVWLSSADKDNDPDAGVTLRQISAILQWPRDFGAGGPAVGDPSMVLSTYVRKGQD